MAQPRTDRANLLDSIAAAYERGEIQPAYDRGFYSFDGPAVGQQLRGTAKQIRAMHAERMKGK